jgi:tetratricopeptide (TPR) repeat protein
VSTPSRINKPTFESVAMKSLDDLIAAFADDDAEALEKAFREAVKDHHPDLHPGDPDAPLRFRQIVAINALLRDVKQANNEWMRQLERQEPQLTPERDQLRSRLERQQLRSKGIRTTLAVAVAGALAGGYVLFASMPTATVVAIKKEKDAANAAVAVEQTAAIAAAPQRNESNPVKDDIDDAGKPVEMIAALLMEPATADPPKPREKHDDAEVPDAANRPNVDASAMKSNNAEIVPDREPAPAAAANDANFYKERGIVAYRSGDFMGAIGNIDEAIRLNPDDAQSYNIRGNVWDELGASERALADYDTAIRIDPNNPAVFHDRAILWQRKGELDKALFDLDRAVRFSFADANVYCDRGFVWYQKGRHERAIADFNQAIKLDPNFAAAYIKRGLIVHNNRDFAVAFADSEPIRVDPSIFDVIKGARLRP